MDTHQVDEFVKKYLTEWNLSGFIQRFADAGVDKEIFLEELDGDMLDNLFSTSECGFRKKIEKKLNALKQNLPNPHNTTYAAERNPINARNNMISACLEPSIPTSSTRIIESPAPANIIPVYLLEKKNIQCLLNTTHLGKLIKGIFDRTKKIDSRRLSDLVIYYEFDFTGSLRISTSRFKEISGETGEIFATELESAEKIALNFYFPSEKVNNKKRNKAGGVYYEKYLNTRSLFIANGLMPDNERTTEDFTDSEQEERIQWLKENDSPKEEVIQKWSDTFDCRDPPANIQAYFESYKCLRTDYGHILLAIDFDKTHTTFITSGEEWSQDAPLIIKYANDKNKLPVDLQELIERGKTEVAAVLCLPNLLGTICRKRKSCGNPFGICIEDVRKSFVSYVKNHDEFEQLKSYRKAEATKLGNSHKIGPYVVFIGNLAEEGSTSNEENELFIVIQENSFKVTSNSILEALNYCFKCMIIAKLDFPVECNHIWFFLAERKYKGTVRGKPYVVVTNFIKELDRLRLESADFNVQI